MSSPAMRIGALELGRVPWVVGVVSRLDLLASPARIPTGCDVVEVRVDLIGPDAPWRGLLSELRRQRVPAILTVRHPSEGGAWSRSEAEREALVRGSLAEVAAVDVELATPWIRDVLPAARAAGVAVIGSFHDFAATPDDAALDDVVARGRGLGVDVVKLATFAREAADLDRLAALLARHRDVPLCVLGMGPLGPASRLSLPLAGSCLTYGFADAESAPGQVAAGELRQRLSAAHAGYRAALAQRG